MIKDGTGKGYIAKVDEENRLWTYSTRRSQIAFQSEYNEKAFMAYGKRNFVAGGVNENILHLTYNGQGSLHIEKVIVSTDSALAKMEMYVDSVYVSGGDLREAINLNRSSRVTPESSIYIGSTDLAFTIDETKEILDTRLGGTSTVTVDFDGGLLLRANNTIGILGSVSNPGEKMRISFFFYEEEDV